MLALWLGGAAFSWFISGPSARIGVSSFFVVFWGGRCAERERRKEDEMLRYTARWFLARTLRTVLSKYLLDIDVDSVYIPYGDAGPSKDGQPAADGGSSSSSSANDGPESGAGGWGIHLSNVRLREGVTLMTLPGPRKRVVTVRRKRKKRPRPGHVPRPQQQSEHGAMTMDQAPQTPMQPPTEFVHENDTRGSEAAVALSPGTPGSMGIDGNAGVYLSDSSYPNSDCDGVLLGSDREDDANSRDFDMDLDIDDHGRGGRIMGYASPPRSAASFVSGTRTPYSPYSTGSSPPTPTGPSWACFARGGRGATARGAPDPTGAATAADAERILLPDDTLGKEGGTSGNTALPPIRPLPSTGYQVEIIDGIETADEYGESIPIEREITDKDNEDDYEYYEEESTIEETMELRVGHGGRIGTLNAKIVGKDYHITVEDADLVLEIAPKPISNTDDAGVAGAGDDAAVDDVKEAERSANAASMSASSTTEDRVMQNSRLARYLAAIPNLYLRDCRVRIILKGSDSKEAGADADKGGTDANNNETSTPTDGEGENNAEDSSSSTTYIVGIDFLSVTGGEDDFLAHARNTNEGGPLGQIRSAPSFREGGIDDTQNEFLRKRVRTGKGPEGGIFIQVISPSHDKRRYPQYYAGRSNDPSRASSSELPSTRWAVKTFASAMDMCLLRLSGLDVSARILLGRRKELEAVAAAETSTNNATPDEAQDYYFDYDGELVMMGTDYFSAGVAPNNDGMLDHMEKGEISEDDSPHDEIETIPIPSNFYRIGRGMRRHGCKEHSHLPSHDCSQCWSYVVQSSSEEKYEMEQDEVMPLPGLVLYFAITDPIEMNIERQGLESLNALKTLFSPGTSQDAKIGNAETDSASISNDQIVAGEAEGTPNFSEENGFPAFMKPEAVHVVGVHLASVCLRLQAMKTDGIKEDGLAFTYWEMQLGALTVDSQNLNTKELAFKDMRISIGQILLYELRGVCRKRLVCLGLDPEENSSAAQENCTVPPTQLCTAATILGVSSSFDALRLLHRHENAVHFRFINIPVSPEVNPTHGLPMRRRCIDVKLGSIDADLPPDFNSDVMTAKKEAMATVMGSVTKESDHESDHDTSSETSVSSTPLPLLLEYTARFDGGKFNMRPRIKCAFPATTLSGQSSSDEGFSIHSVLNRVKFEYGKRNRSDDHLPQAKSNVGIQKFAQLPDACRMGVLFYLEDLRSLEKALGMKENPTHFFLRCRNISQRLGQMPTLISPPDGLKELKRHGRKAKHSKAKASSSSSRSDRKRQLVEKLKNLSIDELERLLAAHERQG